MTVYVDDYGAHYRGMIINDTDVRYIIDKRYKPKKKVKGSS